MIATEEEDNVEKGDTGSLLTFDTHTVYSSRQSDLAVVRMQAIVVNSFSPKLLMIFQYLTILIVIL